jgi:acyl-CoA hydrolase
MNKPDFNKWVKPGDKIFIHGGAATPQFLLKELAKNQQLHDLEFISMSLFGDKLFDISPGLKDMGEVNALFVSDVTRKSVNGGYGNYIPVFLSDIPDLIKKEIIRIDVALIHVSPPDKHGFCSLGVSVDVARAAVQKAKCIIAQVNPNMPRTHGDGLIHISQIHELVDVNDPIPEVNFGLKINPESKKIGELISGMIEDGSTLQTGIGAIPDSVLSNLGNHKNLGVHTELFSDGVLPLVESGVVNNSKKKSHPGKIVTGFLAGSRKLYDFVDDNPMVLVLDIDYVNDPHHIRQNPKVVAINSAIEIDITGQVCADSIGTYQYSGVGGQMDFIRGAALSEGGKPIIAMPSTTNKGESRIVSFLKPGAGVVTTRAHVHYIVTEFGIAYLFGKNLRQRATELIKIAHPNHQEMLEKQAFERFGR